jgi:hypothetical protein
LFAAEAKGEYKDQQVNTIKLTLKPLIGPGYTAIIAAVEKPETAEEKMRSGEPVVY